METMEINKEYLGQLLLEQGFKTWFLYMFRVLEGKPFIVEPIHADIFELFDEIHKRNIRRANLNVPPRSAKTTMCKYFIDYALLKNPKCKFIYTSFNQNLLSDISKEMANMMENPIHKAMYPTRYYSEEFESDPVDNFWREYINRENHKNTYTNRKITTYQGGEILFAAVGSQITGFGASVRGATEFSGGIIQDDLNKPADIHSQTMRDKVLRYYEETLLSRLNDSNGLILNVQQRLHIEDISGYLERKYKFYTLRKPLIDVHGECQIPSQYTAERIEELKFNESMFQAQYQQEPIAERGLIIKRDWWKFYDRDAKDEHGNIINVVNGQVIMTADTAFKVSKGADYSCIQVWELRKDKMIMREMLVDKWEFPELIENAKMLWEKWQNPNFLNKAQYFFIEDKASGSPLQQTLLREGINAIAWRPGDYEYPDDKVGRTKTMSWDIFRGMVYLPENDRMSEYLVNESALFAEDDSQSHDDSVDAASMAHSIWKYYGGGSG